MKENISTMGVDGCPAGWVSVKTKRQLEWEIEIFPTIQELWEANSKAELILIDIPIGLRDKGSIPRLCDTIARKILRRKRSSSIFPTPCRKALEVHSYIQANQINKRLTGKGLSKQTWNIAKKIREVDILLRNDIKAKKNFIESHPELCFAALANGKPMQHYKKTEEGIKERLSILISNYECYNSLLNNALKKFNRKEIGVDDLLDAMVLAITAAKGRLKLSFIPNNFEYDSFGLPMRMAMPKFRKL